MSLPSLMRRGKAILTTAPPARTVAQWFTLCSIGNGLARLSQDSLDSSYRARDFVAAVVAAAENLPPTALSEGCITEAVSLCRWSDAPLELRESIAKLVHQRVSEFAMSKWPRSQLLTRLHCLARGSCRCPLAESMMHVLRTKLVELDANDASVAIWCAARLKMWDLPEFPYLLERCRMLMPRMHSKQLATVQEALQICPVEIAQPSQAGGETGSPKQLCTELETLLNLYERSTNRASMVPRMIEMVQRHRPLDGRPMWPVSTLLRLHSVLIQPGSGSVCSAGVVKESVEGWILQQHNERPLTAVQCTTLLKQRPSAGAPLSVLESALLQRLTQHCLQELSCDELWMLHDLLQAHPNHDCEHVVDRQLVHVICLDQTPPTDSLRLQRVLQLLAHRNLPNGAVLMEHVRRWVRRHSPCAVELYLLPRTSSTVSLVATAEETLLQCASQLTIHDCWRLYRADPNQINPKLALLVTSRIGAECSVAPLDQVMRLLCEDRIPPDWIKRLCQRLLNESSLSSPPSGEDEDCPLPPLLSRAIQKHVMIAEELYIGSTATMNFLHRLEVGCALHVLTHSNELSNDTRVGLCTNVVKGLIFACQRRKGISTFDLLAIARFLYTAAARRLLDSDFRSLVAALQAAGSRTFAATASAREKGLLVVYLQGLIPEGTALNAELLTSLRKSLTN